MTFQSGDLVRLKDEDSMWVQQASERLVKGQTYQIESVAYGIDGAVDWDDVFLVGFDDAFAEFALEDVR